jgi:2-iminobutanoate/2-iminopropanoate deaminase
MNKQIIKPAKSAAAVGPYNHAVRVGDLLFCAGQIPLDPATGNLVSGDIKAQTERVLENLKAILDDQGLTFKNVVKSTVFMVNLADFASMNEIYAKYFTSDFPARSTVQVAALPKGAAVEIEVIAHF